LERYPELGRYLNDTKLWFVLRYDTQASTGPTRLRAEFDCQGDSNFCSISREIRKVDPKAAQNPAQLPPVSAPLDRDLAKIIEAWPTLPDPVRAGIVAMVSGFVPPKQ
jgi:hypothetical protein